MPAALSTATPRMINAASQGSMAAYSGTRATYLNRRPHLWRHGCPSRFAVARPIPAATRPAGFEPATSASGGRCGLLRQPHGFEGFGLVEVGRPRWILPSRISNTWNRGMSNGTPTSRRRARTRTATTTKSPASMNSCGSWRPSSQISSIVLTHARNARGPDAPVPEVRRRRRTSRHPRGRPRATHRRLGGSGPRSRAGSCRRLPATSPASGTPFGRVQCPMWCVAYTRREGESTPPSTQARL